MISAKNILYGAAAVLCSLAILFSSSVNAQIQFEQVFPALPAPQNNEDFVDVHYSSIAFADIDGDNDQDVLITGDALYEPVSMLYLNDGNGNFELISGTPFTGVKHSSVAFADIDNDNDQDVLLSGESDSGFVSELYSNDGSGNFTLVEAPFIGVYRGSIAFSDVDGDNDQDVLITGNSTTTSGYVSELYTNDGSGIFTIVDSSTFVAVNRSSVAFSDIDGDNDQDVLITGSGNNGRVSELYTNDGSGNFTLIEAPFIEVYSGSIAFSDIDGDNDQDVLVTGNNNQGFGIELYTNDGNGNFMLVTETSFAEVAVSSVAFSDIDGDNDQDLLITGLKSISFGNLIEISELYINDGNGNFSLVDDTPFTAVYSGSIAFSDVDGDNDQDLLITGYNIYGRVSELHMNDGSGNYTMSTGSPFTEVAGSSVAFSDIDGDNDQDVLITGSGNNGRVSELYTNDGNGIYTLVEGAPFPGVGGSSIAFADIDGDNDEDVIITGKSDPDLLIAKLYTNDGSGDFTLVNETPFTGFVAGTVAFADIDGDDDQDLILSGSSEDEIIFELYTNDGSGNFALVPETPFPEVDYGSFATSDVDGDSNQDILLTGLAFTGWTDEPISELYVNDGSGDEIPDFYQYPFYGVAVFESSVTFSDIDGDNDQDLLLTGNTWGYGYVSKLYLNNGSGGFGLISGTSLSGVSNGAAAFADFDGDNDQDLLLTGESYWNGPISRLYTNDGVGNFSLVADVPFTGVSGSSIAITDIDGDGDQDVLITGASSSVKTTKLYRNITIIPCAITASCQPFTLELDETGNGVLLTSDIDNGSSVSCGEPILSISQSEFTCLDAGEQEVELTVSDEEGAFETCIAVVTVVPNTHCYDCNGELNGSALPGSICFNDEVEGVFDADCNCVSNNTGSIEGHVNWLQACGSRNITIELSHQTFPDLNQVFQSTIDENGDFSVPVIQAGTYDILITVEGYLSQIYSDVTMESGMNEFEVSNIIAGDVNGSNGINISDFSILNNAFGSSEGDVNYNLLTDFNCDGAVTIVDISILNIAFGMVGDSLPEE